jgi:hypothetical protein
VDSSELEQDKKNDMKTLTIILLSAATIAFTGCKHCNCENANAGTTADRSGMNKDGTDGSGTTSVSVDNETASTHHNGGTPAKHKQSDEPRNTSGVGNADAETGTMEKNAKSTEPAAKEPSKPGTISTRATRGAGTGTSQGRKIN